jgi:hypothetical protein
MIFHGRVFKFSAKSITSSAYLSVNFDQQSDVACRKLRQSPRSKHLLYGLDDDMRAFR